MIRKIFSELVNAYKYTLSYVYNYLKYKFGRKLGKAPEVYIDISKLPEDEKLKVIVERLLQERQEKEKIQYRLRELEEQLEQLKTTEFAKLLERLYKEEKETGKLPISLYDLLSKARVARLIPFRKPPVVYDITMQKLGYLEDMIIHPDGGFSFVISVGKDKYMTPPFGSLWDAIFHPENLASQLPHAIVLCLYKSPDGKLLKVPSELINRVYNGEAVEKIIAELKSTINKLASELESTKVNAEMLSIQNQVEKISRSVSEAVATTSLNMYEKQVKDLKNILIPTTIASINSAVAMELDVAQERSKSEHLRDLIEQYSARIKSLESQLAPENVIAVQNEVINRLKDIVGKLTDITIALKTMKFPEEPQKPQAKETEEEK